MGKDPIARWGTCPRGSSSHWLHCGLTRKTRTMAGTGNGARSMTCKTNTTIGTKNGAGLLFVYDSVSS